MAKIIKNFKSLILGKKEKEIVYNNGKHAVKYDSEAWTIINPEDASDSAYAHLSYMFHFTDDYPKGTLIRKSVYFSDLIDTEDVYHVLKKADPFWEPGTTDRIDDMPYCVGEPIRITPK